MVAQDRDGARRKVGWPRRPVRALLLLAAVSAGLAALLWGADSVGVGELYNSARTQFQGWLQRIPLWLFVISFIVLPAFGVPLSIYYLSAAAALGSLALGLAVALLGMAGNMALSYAMARLLVGPIQRLVARRGYQVPELGDQAQWRLVVALRASPLPWLMQSWLLTLSGIRFSTYMLFGVPVQALVAIALVLIGDSLISGRSNWLVMGLLIALFVYGALGLRPHRLAGGAKQPGAEGDGC